MPTISGRRTMIMFDSSFSSDCHFMSDTIAHSRGETMNNQLVSLINRLLAVAYSLVSNPQRIRVAVMVIVFCLVLATLIAPTVTSFAGALIGGGNSAPTGALIGGGN